MGTELAGAVCGLTLVGYWIDRHYGTGVKGTLIGAALGVVGGTYNFIKRALALSKQTIGKTPTDDENSDGGEHDAGRPTPTSPDR